MHLRWAFPDADELACLALFVGACQAAFLALARSRRPWAQPPSPPSAAVFVPVKGDSPDLAANARAFVDQDYGGAFTVVFVTPAESDPATAALRAALAGSGARGAARVLCSGVVPERSSGMNADTVWALERLRPDAALLVFAVIDCRVRRDWLRRLSAPLTDPGVGLAMATALPVPTGPAAWGVLRLFWIAASLPLLETFRVVGGDALALRRADFERLDVAGLWRRSISSDLVLSPLLRGAGLKPVFVPDAAGENRSGCSAAFFWGTFNKWMAITRVQQPWLWAWGTAFMAFKAFLQLRSLAPDLAPHVGAAAVMSDAAYLMAAVFWARSAHRAAFAGFPGGTPGLAAAALAAAAALPWVFLANAACSLRPRVRWSGRTYRLRGRLDARAEPD